MTDFHPAPGDHPDGIQLWSTNQLTAARNIVIRRNLIVRGAGDPTQGIFVRDTQNQLPFENVTITDNLVVGSLYNGITIMGVTGGTLARNQVVASGDRLSWIRVEHARGVTMQDNAAPKFVLKGEISQRGNSFNARSDHPGDAISRWARTQRVALAPSD